VKLKLGHAHADQVFAHVRAAYPDEGCGVLIGRERQGWREVERVVALANTREDSRGNRYLIAPEEFLLAEKEARGAGLDVLGFFHSHPDHPARPSAFDLEHAWPWYSYVIVSVMEGRVAETTAWRLCEDRTRFDPEALEVEGEGASPNGDAT
jgi:proteasome lid subunit RPN8/RPN11